jgi:O-acetyl-ADP-ribose deacetylase (regulator of RNase III)
LWAYLKLHPEGTAAIAKLAAEASPGDPGAKMVVQALARAGTPDSQRGLATIIDAWRGTDAASAVTPLLAMSAAPTIESENYLRSLRDGANASPDLASTASLALGAVAARVQGSDPDRAAAIADECVERLKAQDGADAIGGALAALGNTGSSRILDVAPSYLTNDDAFVRRMAVHALGQAESNADVRASLERVAASDGDEQVRAEAAKILARKGS